ncbi:MAG: ribose 5-phosphate isomerase B [Deltaproteobacteria bacterium]|nr:ribose 5-phosphate isomerase B [Deltaproteobacteria bacterium]
MTNRIFIGSDHGGFELKETMKSLLKDENYSIEDLGTYSTDSVDYPKIAQNLCNKVLETGDFGILICGTGLGMSMAANKIKGIRAALCSESYSSKMAREHNNANILCMGGRVTGPNLALEIAKTFIETPFEGGRHERRVQMLEPEDK